MYFNIFELKINVEIIKYFLKIVLLIDIYLREMGIRYVEYICRI